MNEDPSTLPPVPRNKAGQKIIWVLVVFLPSLGGIPVVSMTTTDNGALSFLVILNLVCCIAASIGLVRGIEARWLQVLVACLLIPGFFVINAILTFFIGCAVAMSTHGGF